MPYENAEQGMTAAAAHADRKVEDWSMRAERLMMLYASKTGEFMAEEFRFYATAAWALPAPPDARAYGRIVKNLQKRGLIRHVRYERAKNKSAHGGPRSVWVRT